MKLISCYIKGFGNLSNKDIKFDQQGITSFVEDNGYGKSTLAAFIKAMLFGMDTVRETDKDFKDRKHFAPFNCSEYGGTITFIYNNKEYRIERSFDKKSSKKDGGTIYVDGEKVSFDDKIGKTLLKLNKEAFERLLFINSEDTKMELNGNIRQQLNNLIDTTIDGIDYDEVKEKIVELQKRYKGKRGNGGLIPEVKNKINDINRKIEERTLTYNELNEKVNDLKKEEENLSKYSLEREKQNSCRQLSESLKDKKEELNIILGKYLSGVPSLESINKLQQLEKEQIEFNGSINRITDKDDYIRLKNIFYNGVPNENEISELEQIQKDNKLTDNDKELLRTFNVSNANNDYIEVEKLFVEYRNLDEKIKSIPISSNESIGKPKNSKVPLVLLVISIIIIVTGVSLIPVSTIPVIVLCIVGIVFLLLAGGFFLYSKNKIAASNNVISIIDKNNQINSINEIKEKITLIFRQYNICANSIDLGFKEFEDNYNRYNELKEQEQVTSNGNQKARIILYKYDISEDYEIEQLRSDIKSFNNYKNELEELKKKLNSTINEINNILSEYKIESLYKENISTNIKRDSNDINNLTQKVKELESKFKTIDNNLLENNYDQQINEANEKILNLKNDIKTCQTAGDEIEKLKIELEENKDLLKKYEHRYNIIDKTITVIEDSQKTLDKKYVEPIKNKLDNYFKLIEASSSSIEKITLGRDFDIQLDINGEYKSSEHLSSGQKSICALCYRLALLDNVFSNKEFPFIIMDDPFVTLDSNNFKMVSSMLKTISKQKQIIYFSCHDSRKV